MKTGLFVAGLIVGVCLQYFRVPGRVLESFAANSVGEKAAEAIPEPPREAVPLSAVRDKRLFVALAFGQSNGGNHGEGRTVAEGPVYNYYLGKLYRARDPMLGASGDGGSPWPLLGDFLIQSGKCDTAVFCTIAAGGTSVRQWAPQGNLHPLLIHAIRDMKRDALAPTHLLWQQGESDAGMTEAEYRGYFLGMLAAIRSQTPAPVYVAVASHLRGKVAPQIQRAQRGFVGRDGVCAGPDVDSLGNEWRKPSDRTHFSSDGLKELSSAWFAVLGR